jgi:hypothetical protein
MSNSLAALNGNGNHAQDLLDRVLAGRPDDVKARVLELVVRLGIDPRDELFLIMIALGQLQVLIEDSPNDWQTLFHTFQEELTQWTETHLQTLETLASKAETEDRLATTCNELVNSLTRLTSTCSELMIRLNASPPAWRTSESNSMGLIRDSDQLRAIEHNLSETLHRSHHHLSQQLSRGADVKGSIRFWGCVVLGVQIATTIILWRLH